MDRISLADALASDRLEDFIRQSEADGVGPADRGQFEALLGLVTEPQQAGQTSRSPGSDCSRGK